MLLLRNRVLVSRVTLRNRVVALPVMLLLRNRSIATRYRGASRSVIASLRVMCGDVKSDALLDQLSNDLVHDFIA